MSAARFTVEDVRLGGLGDLDAVVLSDTVEGSRVTVVPSRGALVTSLFARGREWLYLDEATLRDRTQNVRGGVPVLFPSPGKLEGERYAFGGHERAMRQHGFARRSAFREVSRTGGPGGQAQVELELTDSEVTRAEYPWPFRLRIRYGLRGAELTLTAEVTNTGAEAMPFALGYHPYFAVPDAAKLECQVPTKSKRAWDNVRREERISRRSTSRPARWTCTSRSSRTAPSSSRRGAASRSAGTSTTGWCGRCPGATSFASSRGARPATP